MRTIFIAAALAAAFAQAAAAQVVHGRIVDAGTGAPVRAAVWLREVVVLALSLVRARAERPRDGFAGDRAPDRWVGSR